MSICVYVYVYVCICVQKYHHKGSFYMDQDSLAGSEDVRRREVDEPTLEDKTDRASLPAVLQVKKFGFRGRTKYTHLLDQDTCRGVKDRLLPNEDLRQRYSEKRAGMGDIDSAGRSRKKQKE